MSFSSNKNCNF